MMRSNTLLTNTSSSSKRNHAHFASSRHSNSATTTGDSDKMEYHYYKTRWCKTVEKYHKECPYESRCMFAHSEEELRTEEQNIADGLVTAEAVREHQRRLQHAEKKRAKRKLKRQKDKLKSKVHDDAEKSKQDDSHDADIEATTSIMSCCNLSVASADDDEETAYTTDLTTVVPELTLTSVDSPPHDSQQHLAVPSKHLDKSTSSFSSTPSAGGISEENFFSSNNQSSRTLFSTPTPGDRTHLCPNELLELSASFFKSHPLTAVPQQPTTAPPTKKRTVFAHNPYSIDTPYTIMSGKM